MVGHLAFALEGRQLAVAYDQKLAVIDCATGNVVSHWEVPMVSRGLAAQPAGRIFATVDGTPTVKLWDITSGKQQAAVDVGIGPVTAVAFAPDGTTTAAGAAEGRIAQWDVAT
jgi:WD40 repeat protein